MSLARLSTEDIALAYRESALREAAHCPECDWSVTPENWPNHFMIHHPDLSVPAFPQRETIIDMETGEILENAPESETQSREFAPAPPVGVSWTVGNFTVTEVGLEINGEPTFEKWEAFGKTLQFLERTVQFAIGDWINYGEHRWGEKYAQAVDETGNSQGTLRNYAWASGRVNLSLRSDKLKFNHHVLVAPLSHADGTPDQERQRYYLELAVQQELSVARLRQIIKADERARQLEAQTPPAVNADTNIILGDCTAVTWPANIDLIIADPPFGLTTADGKSGVREGKGDWDNKDYDELHAFNAEWLTLACDALKDEGSIFVFGTVHNIFSIGHILKQLGLYVVRDIVWRKPFVQRQVNLNALVPEHELIIWARKGKRHTCNLTEITRDVWDVQPSAPHAHPAEKPEALIQRLIDMASNPGEIIADPFLGSGTTAAVAAGMKRAYWGVEQDEYWWKVATERVRF